MVMVLLAAGLVAVVASRAAKAPDWDTQARQRLADYVYMESQRALQANGNVDDYMLLLAAANDMAGRNDFASLEYGRVKWATAQSQQEAEEAVERMRLYFDAHPEDYYSSLSYLNVVRDYKDIEEAVRVGAVIDSLFPSKTELTLDHADDLAMLGLLTGDSTKVRQAMALLDRIEAGTGPVNWVVGHKMRIHAMAGDSLAVLGEVQRFVREAPREADNMIFAAKAFQALSQPDSAMAYYDEAIRLDAADPNAYLGRAQIYRERGDSAAFDQEIFRIMELPGADVDAKTDLIIHYVRTLYADSSATNEARIRRMFQSLTDIHPLEPEVRRLHGSYLATVRDWKGAAEQFGYATDLAPDNEEAWAAYATALANTDDYARAHQVIDKVATTFPSQALPMMQMELYIYTKEEKLDSCITSINRFLDTDTLTAELRSQMLGLLGDTYYRKGDTLRSAQYYEDAIAADTTNFMAMNNYAYHLSVIDQDLDRALELATKAVNSDAANPTYLDTYAWILFKQKNYPKAKEYIDLTLQSYENVTDPDDAITAEGYSHAGDIYFMNGLPDQALEFWQKALELDPDDDLLQRKVKHKTFFFK